MPSCITCGARYLAVDRCGASPRLVEGVHPCAPAFSPPWLLARPRCRSPRRPPPWRHPTQDLGGQRHGPPRLAPHRRGELRRLLLQHQRLHARRQADDLHRARRHPRAGPGHQQDQTAGPQRSAHRGPTAAPRRAAGGRPGMVHALVVGHKTNSVFFTKTDPRPASPPSTKPTPTPARSASWSTCPPKRSIVSVNADETLVAGTYIEGDATGKEYGSNAPARRAARAGAARQPRRQRRPGAALPADQQGRDDGGAPRRPPSARPLHPSPRARPQRRKARHR